MQTIILILVGILLLKGAYDVIVGLLQILAGIACGIGGVILYLLSYVVEALENLWEAASSQSSRG